MLHEDVEYRFCPVCGGNLTLLALKDHEPPRLVCSRCRFVFYQDPKVVACAIIETAGRIILLKRSIEPQKGKWVMPGGYVDRGEEVSAAAIRETREECGLETRITKLHGVYSYPQKLAVVVVYLVEALGGDLKAGDESEEVGLYRPEEIPWDDLAFQSTSDALRDYCKTREKTQKGKSENGVGT
jgi:ADP-ribose pyrophosphatase YjhB (NUDIX family)